MPHLDNMSSEERQETQRQISAGRLRDQFRTIARRELAEFFDIDMEDPKERRAFQDDFRRFRESRVFWDKMRERSMGAIILAIISAAGSYIAVHWKN